MAPTHNTTNIILATWILYTIPGTYLVHTKKWYYCCCAAPSFFWAFATMYYNVLRIYHHSIQRERLDIASLCTRSLSGWPIVTVTVQQRQHLSSELQYHNATVHLEGLLSKGLRTVQQLIEPQVGRNRAIAWLILLLLHVIFEPMRGPNLHRPTNYQEPGRD